MINRRTFLQSSVAASAVGLAVGAGLLTPHTVMAAWPKDVFETKSMDDAVKIVAGDSTPQSQDGGSTMKAPELAENGAVVPISAFSPQNDIETIAIFIEKNPTPAAVVFNLSPVAEAYVSTRVKMAKTSTVKTIFKTKDGKLYEAQKEVKVTVGGCGG